MIGCRAGFSRIESAAIVFDDGLDVTNRTMEDNAGAFRAGMFNHIIECFLNDSVERRLDLARNSGRHVLTGLDLHFDAAPDGPCCGEIADGFNQTQVVERGWAQFQRHAMKITRGLRGQVLEWQDPLL